MLSSQFKGFRKRSTRPVLLHRPQQISGANEDGYATRLGRRLFCCVNLLV
jgi:hypothetical protein